MYLPPGLADAAGTRAGMAQGDGREARGDGHPTEDGSPGSRLHVDKAAGVPVLRALPRPRHMSKCPMCGAEATFEIRLPDGSSIPAANLVEANGLLRTHQRQWPGEDLSIEVAASPKEPRL